MAISTYNFNTPEGQTIDRELLVAYLQTGTTTGESPAPIWSILGTRVEEASQGYDWQTNTIKDILGKTYTTMKKPIVTQSFDPYPLDAGDAAQEYLWQKAVVAQDANAMAAQTMLIVHMYASNGTAGNFFAEMYDGCAIEYAGLGGAGGGNMDSTINVTYGGNRKVGYATVTSGVPSFTEETDSTSVGG